MNAITARTIRRTDNRKHQDGNCFLWGCAGVVVITMVVVIGASVALYLAYRNVYEEYTSADPIELPVVEATQEEIDALLAKVETFGEALDTGETADPLVLSERDINILIQHHKDLDKINDKMYVTIPDDEITGQMSVPLSELPGFSGRYFTGVATFDVRLSDGRLEVYVESAEIAEKAVPDTVMEQVRADNLAADFQREMPELQEYIDKLESVIVSDGKVTITPRAPEEL